jgi:hypothetical protein
MFRAVHARGEQGWKSDHLEPFSFLGRLKGDTRRDLPTVTPVYLEVPISCGQDLGPPYETCQMNAVRAVFRSSIVLRQWKAGLKPGPG